MKAALKAALLAELESALATARAAHEAAVEGATHEDARAENDKDTRGLEQSYLARGHAERVATLDAAVVAVGAMAVRAFADGEPIAVGALVTVREDAAVARYFIAPEGGGTVLAGGAVSVVTPASPLGRALIERTVDDDVELRVGAKLRELSIAAVD